MGVDSSTFRSKQNNNRDVAQLASASGLGPEGRRFIFTMDVYSENTIENNWAKTVKAEIANAVLTRYIAKGYLAV